jgi:hypothetical protein
MTQKSLIEKIEDLNNPDIASVWEMSNVLKKHNQGKIPVNIYIDNTGSFKDSKHRQRIKVQNDYGDRYNGNTYTITLETTPRIIGEIKIKKKDHQIVYDLIIAHRELLIDIAEQRTPFSAFLAATGLQ